MFLMCYLKINTQCYATVVYTRIQRSLCKLHVVHSSFNIQCLNDISAKRHVEQTVSSSFPQIFCSEDGALCIFHVLSEGLGQDGEGISATESIGEVVPPVVYFI
jgi:hypothetical protein